MVGVGEVEEEEEERASVSEVCLDLALPLVAQVVGPLMPGMDQGWP